jgi:hypothetical protein
MSKTEEDARQIELARWIGQTLHSGADLMPLGPHSSFALIPMGGGLWMDKKVGELAWQAPAYVIARQFGHRYHVIDHAWLAGHASHPHESWALIAEPYLSSDVNEQIEVFLAEYCAEWGLRAECLSTERSSWNPGSCRRSWSRSGQDKRRRSSRTQCGGCSMRCSMPDNAAENATASRWYVPHGIMDNLETAACVVARRIPSLI